MHETHILSLRSALCCIFFFKADMLLTKESKLFEHTLNLSEFAIPAMYQAPKSFQAAF